VRPRVVVLGGGHGVVSVLRALRYDAGELTALVTVADDGGSSGELRRHYGGPAVGDMRRSLVALTDGEAALARAFARPLAISHAGTHPLGNLVIRSLAEAFGDLAEASRWIGAQLGVAGVVLPASAEPVSLIGEVGDQVLHGECAIGTAPLPIRRLHFDPPRPRVHAEALAAIAGAQWVLLAPGSLFTSVLAAGAVPDIAFALRQTEATVVWVANVAHDPRGETAGMSGSDHLAAFRSHGVRVDAVLYDPAAELRFNAETFTRHGLVSIAAPLCGPTQGVHDVPLLRAALCDLLADDPLCLPADLAARG
jgi:uncharacterized cofD-like protein